MFAEQEGRKMIRSPSRCSVFA